MNHRLQTGYRLEINTALKHAFEAEASPMAASDSHSEHCNETFNSSGL